ncbi:MAG: hypothetical protein QM783_05560 [Phycisphaerales bacterium]
MTLTDDNKVTILLELQHDAVEQLAEIKREEMKWLQTFLVFYGALVAWGASRWLPVSPSSRGADDTSLVHWILTVSFLATLLFTYHFIRTRWSYYGVAARLSQCQHLLHLYTPLEWGGKAPLGDSPYGRLIDGFGSWRKATKPMSSFLTRIVYLVGANLMVASICWRGFEEAQRPQPLWFFLCVILANMVVIALGFMIDFIHFSVPPKKS